MDILSREDLLDMIDKYKIITDTLYKYIPNEARVDAIAEAADVIRSERSEEHYNDWPICE